MADMSIAELYQAIRDLCTKSGLSADHCEAVLESLADEYRELVDGEDSAA